MADFEVVSMSNEFVTIYKPSKDQYFSYNYTDLPGNSWNANRISRLEDWIRENIIDDRTDQNSLPIDDEERTWTNSQFYEKYHGRRFLSGTTIIDRPYDISISVRQINSGGSDIDMLAYKMTRVRS